MHEDIKQLDSHLKQVEEASNNAKVLRNKAHYLIKELDMFQEAYLVNMS
jgi:fzo-like conserved region.